ncbi:GNAT family N-acetyltransferase [Methylobacterium nonmethylotrophicum]|uniref:GNAT family N-acetyltransferase n=1 Tax=Methylobacterium nonmethylotrophicum TaxID=1141884 RepID=A0A4Z0NKA2_9HYPH|nr:GNAT family N-acetyltransferase [Methylobacterium nonmethylotrophicum]TGD96606.1 GNAT family N-acetyltransferase [Methylobacterium nonmethylotrophicum]
MNAHAIPLPGRAADLVCEVTDLSRLSREPAAWDALAARAAGSNPDYSRRVLEAHRDHRLGPADLACLAVRAGPQLLALLPFRTGRGPLGLGRVARPFASPYLTVTAPLVAAGPEGAPALASLAAGMRALGCPWWWPLLPTDGPVGPALLAALARDGWGRAEVASVLRPVLDRRASHDAFLTAHPHKGRLKDLRRRRRRLDEAGAVTIEAVGPDGDLARAVEAFLALEASGWKGRAGTALACRRETADFARDLFRAGGGPVTARADLLRLDGRVVAASLALVGGGTATLLKTAYDEALRHLAPGVLLEAEIVRALHESRFADRLDSATLDSAVLDDLYPERTRIAEIVLSPPGGPSPERVANRARRQHAAKGWIKARLARLRGR